MLERCRVTEELNAYLAAERREDRRAEAVETEIERLTAPGGGYYPFTPGHVAEAMAGLPTVDLVRIADKLRGQEVAQAGGALFYAVSNYWRRQARAEAEDCVACACPQCYGTGCRACDDEPRTEH